LGVRQCERLHGGRFYIVERHFLIFMPEHHVGSAVLPTEERTVPRGWTASKKMLDVAEWERRDPEGFWREHSKLVDWFKPWKRLNETDESLITRWFIGGELNASYNCLDRHVNGSRKNKVAYFWEGERAETRTLTYRQLYREVNRFADALRRLGLNKGDRVAVYLPMIPELPITMLSAVRLGAIHLVVFSGFGASALADRINLAEAKLLVTADGAYRGGKRLDLKEVVDEALPLCPSVEQVVVVKRTGHDVPMKPGRDIWWHEATVDAETYVEPLPVESTHPTYILPTSGTTGKPKGSVHSTGGYLVWVCNTLKWCFDVKDEDIWWCTADIGWVTGHSYIVYAPLALGVTSVMYEGHPLTPAPDRWWSIVEKYGVTVFYTTPTAIRMLLKFGDGWPTCHNLSSLRILGTVGEPINPEAWRWYYKLIGKERCPIIDTWWQTETGGFCVAPTAGLGIVPLKPGSATYPLPRIKAEVVDEKGNPLPKGEKGFFVIKEAWPGLMQGLWKDPERYRQLYWERIPGWYYVGDYAMKDEDGYFWFLGRADDVLKVAGHRIGTMELENTLIMHPTVAESCVVARPHDLKGEEPVFFVTLKQGCEPSEDLKREIVNHVRRTYGPIGTPGEVFFVSKIPKTRSGKIMRRLVRATITEASLGDVSTLEDEAAVEDVRRAYEEIKKTIGKQATSA